MSKEKNNKNNGNNVAKSQNKSPVHQPSIKEMEEMARKHTAEKGTEERLRRIADEFREGFEFMQTCKNAVSVFGSARSGFKDEVYHEAERLSFMLAKEGFPIVTGGGPGIMEAANKGAYEAEGRSIGFTIDLPSEQGTNKYVKEEVCFHYFFARKVMLSFSSKVYIFFPGGFGTMDELFEMLTLIQTGKMERILIVLVRKAYWEPLLRFIEDIIYKKGEAISEHDLQLYHLVDSAEEAFDYIKSKRGEFFSNNEE